MRRPRRPKVTSTRTRALRRPALKRTGSGSSGSSIQPGGSGRRPAIGLDPHAQRLLLDDAAGVELAVRRSRPTRRRRSRPPRRAPEQQQRRAGDVERLGVERARRRAAAGARAPRTRAPSARPGSLERRRRRDRVGDDLGAADPRGLGHEHDAVREHDVGERLDVVGQRVVAARAAARAPWRRAAASGRRAARRRARRGGRRACGAAARRCSRAAPCEACTRRAASWHSSTSARSATGSQLEHAVAALVAGEHPRLLGGARVAELEPDHEAVDLRLGQRVGALVLDRVLRREDEERAGELVRVRRRR